MKKFLSIILVLALVCGLCSVALASGEKKSGDFKYKVLSDNTVEIVKYTSFSGTDTMIIPETIDGLPVTSIGKGAFQYASIKTLEIGENITNIGDTSFFGCSATSVTIKGKDIKIGKKAFSCCNSIKDFTLIANNVEIGEAAFMYTTPLTNFTWELADKDAQGTKTVIGDTGFFSSGVVDITIPGDDLVIGKKAFSCCSSIKSMTALCKTITIGDSAFMYAEFDSFTLPNAGSVGEATGKIGETGFFSCGLKSFVVPASIQKIGGKAFSCCSSLTSIVIPPTVTSIADRAFQLSNSSLVAKVVKGSTADQFCTKNRITVEYITEDELTAIYGEGFVEAASQAKEAAEQKAASEAKPKNETVSNQKYVNYGYMKDKWNWYRATFLSDSVLKIEKWNRWQAGANGDPFEHKYDVCTINIADGSTDFVWIDDTQTAFSISLNDENDSDLDGSKRIGFAVDKSELNEPVEYSYMNDKWDLYRAVALSDTTVKVERWSRFNAGEDGDPFAYDSDICIIEVGDSSTDFAWTDDEHVAFTVTMQDEENSYWDDPKLTPFSVEPDAAKHTCYTYQNDKWDLYKAYRISDKTLVVENWSRFNAGEDGDPFKKERVICIIKTEDPSTDFKWSDSNQVAFTITMQDTENSYWDEEKITPFGIETSNADYPVLSYLNDRWDLYRAFILSDNTIVIQDWTRFNAGEDGDPFKREHDVCIISLDDNTSDFKWIDNSHTAFTITMQDDQNSYWDGKQTVTYTDKTDKDNSAKIAGAAQQQEDNVEFAAEATPIPHETVESTPEPTSAPTETPTEEPVEDTSSIATVEPLEQIIDLSGYTDAEILAINAQIRAEIANRKIEKTATVPPGKYLVGRDLPAGQYILKNTSGDTAYIAIFKDNANKYKDSEAVNAFNFWADRETTVTLEDGQLFEVRHQTIEVTVSAGIVFQ